MLICCLLQQIDSWQHWYLLTSCYDAAVTLGYLRRVAEGCITKRSVSIFKTEVRDFFAINQLCSRKFLLPVNENDAQKCTKYLNVFSNLFHLVKCMFIWPDDSASRMLPALDNRWEYFQSTQATFYWELTWLSPEPVCVGSVQILAQSVRRWCNWVAIASANSLAGEGRSFCRVISPRPAFSNS